MVIEKGRGLGGVISAPVVPMMESGEVDWDCLTDYAKWVIDQRPAGVALNMSAGEGYALSAQEQRRILETYRAASGDGCIILGSVIASATHDAVAKAKQLKKWGADAMVLFPPVPLFLGQPLPAEVPVAYHRQVAEESELPTVVFQFAPGQGPDYDDHTVRQLATLERVIGIKDASFDPGKFIQLRGAIGDARVALLTGGDSMLFEEFLMGADGALVGLGSIYTAEVVRIWSQVQAGAIDDAWRMWQSVAEVARFVWRPPFRDYRARLKEILVARGVFRFATVRRPLLSVGEREQNELRRLDGVVKCS